MGMRDVSQKTCCRPFPPSAADRRRSHENAVVARLRLCHGYLFYRSGEAVNKTVKYVIGRLLFLIPIMLILSFFVFALTYMSPLDPVTLKYQRIGEIPDQALIEQEKEAMGLNDPFLVQYGRWLGKALHGDLGESYKTGKPVWKTMTERIPNTLKLTGATLLLTVLLAVPLGVVSAVNQNRFVDYLIRFISFFGVSMPSFWVGFMLMYVFGVKLKLLPVMGSGDFKHIILPSLALAFWMVSLRAVLSALPRLMAKCARSIWSIFALVANSRVLLRAWETCL